MVCVLGVYIGVDKVVSQPRTSLNLTIEGIYRDRHFSRNKEAGIREPHTKGTEIFNYRSVSIVSKPELEIIAEKMGVKEIKPEWLGANIYVDEPITNVFPMTILTIGKAEIIVYGPNKPCKHPGNIIKREYKLRTNIFEEVAVGYRGIVGWVEKEGIVRPGDIVHYIQ